jgi:hypothetical protein
MFERHMMDCEDCWSEVDLGRKGRSVAESARELAPQDLRERVRSAVEMVTPRRRRPPWVFGAGALLLVAMVVGVATFLSPARDPQEIQEALATFRGPRAGSVATPQLPARLGRLELVRTFNTEAGEIKSVAHTYVDPSGDEVIVLVADERWPAAEGARHDNAGDTWVAEKDGLVMICIDEPAPSLVVGDDLHDVELAAYALRP